MEFVEFYDRWINRYLVRDQVPLCQEEEELMGKDFLACVARHRLGIPAYDAPWGWKEPRSHYLLPFFHAKYPDMKLIHVVRDGRDMAFSSNQNQLRKHSGAILDPSLRKAPQPVQAASLWAKTNLAAASYGERKMPERYIMIQYERLCVAPLETAKALTDFLGCSDVDLHSVVVGISLPESIGRWHKTGDQSLLSAVQAQADEALGKFGYRDL
jgi:hypothetical protein